MQWKSTILAGMLGALLLGGCSGAVQRVGEPFSRAPEVETEQIALGQRVFMQHCHQCHPHGEGGIAPMLNDRAFPRLLVDLQVRHGFGAMPAFPRSVITNEELGALNEYMRALRQAAEAKSLRAAPPA